MLRILISTRRSFSRISHAYQFKVANNQIKYDKKQENIVMIMNKLQQHLENSGQENVSAVGNNTSPMLLKGLYIWGGVGIGKTMLMDLFFSTINIKQKRRVHFHKFMLEVHQHIHHHKQHLLQTYGRDVNLNLSSERDSIKFAADMIRKDSYLLCFDEFQVTDIADAIIMTKLFNNLWKNGIVLIATSNRPPSELYLGGLNRQYFLPFIEELSRCCIVRHLDSNLDYRSQQDLQQETYFTPLNSSSTSKLRQLFELNTHHRHLYHNNNNNKNNTNTPSVPQMTEIPVMMGRKLTVESIGDSCWVTFQQLCCNNLGASDYSALARHMNIIYLDGIPCLSVLEHDVARRFITLIDEIYDAGKLLLWTSEKCPNELFQQLTPNRLISNNINLGTDHSWSNRDIIQDDAVSQSMKTQSNEENDQKKSLPQKAPFDSLSIAGTV